MSEEKKSKNKVNKIEATKGHRLSIEKKRKKIGKTLLYSFDSLLLCGAKTDSRHLSTPVLKFI